MFIVLIVFFFFSSRRRHTRLTCDWSSDVCSSDLIQRSSDGGSTWETVRTLDGDDGILSAGAPQVVYGATTIDGGDTLTRDADLPAPDGGILEDDLMIAFAAFSGNPSITWPAGWTEIKDQAGNGSLVRAGVAWKRCVGGETGTITVTTSAAETGVVMIKLVRGAHTSTAPEVSTGV